jgi:hypothetical protein
MLNFVYNSGHSDSLMAENLSISVHYADVCKETLRMAENLRYLIIWADTAIVGGDLSRDCTDASEIVSVRYEIDNAANLL